MELVSEWFGAPWSALGMAAATGVLVFLGVIAYTRLMGLRSFAKMSSVDFAGTVAVGSGIATVTLSKSVTLSQGLAGLAGLYAVQWTLSQLRKRSGRASDLLDNQPILLMRDGEVLHDNLERAGVTIDDIRSKLREANVLDPRRARAVVFETTGDVSVLHGDPDGPDVDPWLLEGIREG